MYTQFIFNYHYLSSFSKNNLSLKEWNEILNKIDTKVNISEYEYKPASFVLELFLDKELLECIPKPVDVRVRDKTLILNYTVDKDDLINLRIANSLNIDLSIEERIKRIFNISQYSVYSSYINQDQNSYLIYKTESGWTPDNCMHLGIIYGPGCTKSLKEIEKRAKIKFPIKEFYLFEFKDDSLKTESIVVTKTEVELMKRLGGTLCTTINAPNLEVATNVSKSSKFRLPLELDPSAVVIESLNRFNPTPLNKKCNLSK